jgi:type I restriction enzyme S subunit
MNGELRPYPDYKDSGLAWLGKVPSHWKIHRNGRLFAQRNETGFGDLPILEVSLKTGVRVRDMENLRRKQVMSDREKYKRAKKGDVAYNMMRMWQGAVGAAPVDGLVSPAYVVARPFLGTETRYFSYLFRTHAYMTEVDGYSRGIVKDRNRLYWEDFKRMFSCYPLPEEQAVIADYLDANATLVRKFIRNRRRLITLLNEQKQALISKVVTRGLDPSVQRKSSSIAWLGEVPQHWHVKKLRFLVDTRGGMTPSKANPSYWNGSVPWVSPKDMKTQFISGSIDHITDLALRESGIQLVSAPAVLIVVRGMILARTFPVGVTTIPVTINQDMKALLPRDDLSAHYMRHLLVGLQNAIHMLVEESGHGTRVLRTDLWRNLSLPIPPRDEQQRISDVIDRDTATTDIAIAKAEREIDLIHEFRARLIADVVTGKLDVRHLIVPREEFDETCDDDLSDDESELVEETVDVEN